jgi:HEAT repeat protein
MGNDRPRKVGAETPQAEARPRTTRRFPTGVRGSIIVVACCIGLGWAAWSLWEGWYPVGAPALQLHFGKASRRVRAARELMEAGVKEPGRAVPPLIAALGDPEPGVRAAAAEALGVIGGEAARTGAAGELPRMAAVGLIQSLKDREPSVRVSAMNALVALAVTGGEAGSIDLQRIIAALDEALGERDEDIRLIALDALRQCGPIASLVPPAGLVAALADRSNRVRAATVPALASFRCPLDPWLDFLLRGVEDDNPEVSLTCWAALSRTTPPAFSATAIPALISALGKGARVVRFLAARALEPHAHDPRVSRVLIPALLVLLRDPIGSSPVGSPGRGPYITLHAADMLGRLAPGTASAGEVVAALAEAVRTVDPIWRDPAIRALGEFGPAAEPAIPALVHVLRRAFTRKDSFAFQGDEAVRALAKIAPGTRSADIALVALIEILKKRPEPSEATPVLSLLFTRLAAIEAVPKFGPMAVAAIPQLRACRHDSDARLKRAASSALEAIEGTRPGDGDASRGRWPP